MTDLTAAHKLSVFDTRRKSRALKKARFIQVDDKIVSILIELLMKKIAAGHYPARFTVSGDELYYLTLSSIPSSLREYAASIPREYADLTIILSDDPGSIASFSMIRKNGTSNYTPVIYISCRPIPLNMVEDALRGRNMEPEQAADVINRAFTTMSDALHHELRHYMQFIGTMAINIRDGVSVHELNSIEIFENLKYGTEKMDVDLGKGHVSVGDDMSDAEALNSYYNSKEEFNPTTHTLSEELCRAAIKYVLYLMETELDVARKMNRDRFIQIALRVCNKAFSQSPKHVFIKSLEEYNPKKAEKVLKLVYQECEERAGKYYDKNEKILSEIAHEYNFFMTQEG